VTGSIGDWYADREDSSFGDAADDERVEWHPYGDVDDETAPPEPARAEAAAAPPPSRSSPSSSTVSEEERQRILMAAALRPDDSSAELVDVLGRTYTVVTRDQVIAVLRQGGIVRAERPAPRPAPPTPSPATRTAASGKQPPTPPVAWTSPTPSGVVVEHLTHPQEVAAPPGQPTGLAVAVRTVDPPVADPPTGRAVRLPVPVLRHQTELHREMPLLMTEEH
jgi:pyruvate/2-oxoglutarate dehydrogenase complex dihydrolipoamide acyltransferase (E2) component